MLSGLGLIFVLPMMPYSEPPGDWYDDLDTSGDMAFLEYA